jgi:hypothetical protein
MQNCLASTSHHELEQLKRNGATGGLRKHAKASLPKDRFRIDSVSGGLL